MKAMSSKDKKKQQSSRKGSHISKQAQKYSKKQPKTQSPGGFCQDKCLLRSNRLPSSHPKNHLRAREAEGVKYSHKVITTDESNNCYQSKIQESIFYCENKEPNDQYFHSLSIKPKKTKRADSRSSSQKSSKLKDVSCKLKQMHQLVLAQDRELGQLKGTISEKELHRLIKMHSIERLNVVLTVKSKSPSKRKPKK